VNYIAIVIAGLKIIVSAIRAKAYAGSDAFRLWSLQLKSPRYAVLVLGILASCMFIWNNGVFIDSRKYDFIESLLDLYAMIAFLILTSFWVHAHARQDPSASVYATAFSHALIPVSAMAILGFVLNIVMLSFDMTPHQYADLVMRIIVYISFGLVVVLGFLAVMVAVVDAAMRIWMHLRARYMQAEPLPRDPNAEGIQLYLDKVAVRMSIAWFSIVSRIILTVLFAHLRDLTYDAVAYGILLVVYKTLTTALAVSLISASLLELLKFGTEAIDSEQWDNEQDEGQELLSEAHRENA